MEPHTGSHPPQFPTATRSNGEASRAGESGTERGRYSRPGGRHFAGEVLSQSLLIILSVDTLPVKKEGERCVSSLQDIYIWVKHVTSCLEADSCWRGYVRCVL